MDYVSDGEKWGLGHKCPTQVSIHVGEELLDALDDGGEPNTATVRSLRNLKE